MAASSRPQSIHQVNDVSASLKSINLLIYSHPGEGKTPFWGTGGERLLMMDSDHGYESAAANGSKCYRIPVTDYVELQEAFDWLKNGGGTKEFDWVVWDSITLFQNRTLIDEIMADAVAENPRQEEFVPSRREYLINMNRILRYVRLFVDLDINFGVSAHVLEDKDPEGGTKLWMPAIQGKNMPSNVCGYMNVIGFLGHTPFVNGTGGVPRLLTQRVGRFYARDRFMALGQHIDRPTVPKVEELINAKRSNLQAQAPVRNIRRRRATASS